MELVDEVEVVQRLDVVGTEPGLLMELAEGALDDPLAGLEGARDALPESGEDPSRRAADEQDLGPLDAAGRHRDSEHPAVDEVGPERAHGWVTVARTARPGRRRPSPRRPPPRADTA